VSQKWLTLPLLINLTFCQPIFIITVAVCVTKKDHYILHYILSKHALYLRRLCTDYLETSPHDIGSTAIENDSFTFSYVPLSEIRGQNPILAIFSDTSSRFCEEILQF